MTQRTDSNVRTWGPTLLGIVFAILQGFTVYFTKNVETSLTKLENKLDQTWDITIVTQAKMGALESQNVKLEKEQAKLQTEVQRVREELLRHVAEHP
ncbi:hypothetical protein FIU82_06035 [Pseudoalteromonas sp. THAF3]|nr:hypothetical protein FIU82_06035 [Pseudoalteromonas sp. THAF3]